MESKVLAFLCNMQNTYKEEKEEVTIDFDPYGDLTEDFTAMLVAFSMFYKKMTGDDKDLIGFTHLLNRLAMQYIFDGSEED